MDFYIIKISLCVALPTFTGWKVTMRMVGEQLILKVYIHILMRRERLILV